MPVQLKKVSYFCSETVILGYLPSATTPVTIIILYYIWGLETQTFDYFM